MSVHSAVENECVECLQCRRQRQAGSWGQRTAFPVDAWQQQAPAGVDPESGDAAWVADTNDVRLLHWMCVSRGLDAGGSNTEMVSRLRGWSRSGAEAEGQQHQREGEMDRLYGPPPAYAASGAAEGTARRCIMMPVVVTRTIRLSGWWYKWMASQRLADWTRGLKHQS